ncbi:MAG: PQ-loop repeat-containing protein [Candidatus Moranbacteria bacterium]|nr:PQ-loop repeat-containing protein [Candidatus Moranbacteria bacterium]
MENVNNILGMLVALVSIAVVGSLALQAWKNYKRKSTEGFSPSIPYVGALAYSLWAGYAWTKQTPDYYLGYSQASGALVAYLLVYQVIRYKRTGSTPS